MYVEELKMSTTSRTFSDEIHKVPDVKTRKYMTTAPLILFINLYIPVRVFTMNLQGQDWNTVVLKQKHQTTSQKTSAAAVNAALRSGMSDIKLYALQTRECLYLPDV